MIRRSCRKNGQQSQQCCSLTNIVRCQRARRALAGIKVELWRYAGGGPASPHRATLVFIEWNLKADWLLTSNVLHSGPERCGAVSVSSQLTYIGCGDPLGTLCPDNESRGLRFAAEKMQIHCDVPAPPTPLWTVVCLFAFPEVKIPFRRKEFRWTRALRDRVFV